MARRVRPARPRLHRARAPRQRAARRCELPGACDPADFLYIRNYRPDRWPAGDPETYFAVGPFGDIDPGPSKSLLLDRRDDPEMRRFFELATAKRPAEELYDLRKDSDQRTNVAAVPTYAKELERLRSTPAD